MENLLQRYDDPELVESLENLRKVSASLDADVSYLAWMLRPKVLDDLGLASALGQFVREFSGRYDVNAQFEAVGVSDDKLEPEVQTNLYRIAQEALTNCAKHADARHVSILLNQDADILGLIIEDDGCGFDEQSPPTNNGTHGLGLAGMRDRAKLIGADLSIESSDQGTTIFVRLPLPERSERALSRTREENTSA